VPTRRADPRITAIFVIGRNDPVDVAAVKVVLVDDNPRAPLLVSMVAVDAAAARGVPRNTGF